MSTLLIAYTAPSAQSHRRNRYHLRGGVQWLQCLIALIYATHATRRRRSPIERIVMVSAGPITSGRESTHWSPYRAENLICFLHLLTTTLQAYSDVAESIKTMTKYL